MQNKIMIKITHLVGILLMIGVSAMTNANELTFKELRERDELKYGPEYLITTTIPVTISEKVKLTPDMAVFSIRLFTQAKDAKTAFNNNAASMTAFREFLTELNIADDDLKTLSYRNAENCTDKPISTNEKDSYRSTLIVSARFDSNQFFDVVALLEKYHVDVSKLNGSSSNYYKFNISEISTSADLAKSTVKERFASIQQKLEAMNIKQIDISDYQFDVIKLPAKTERVKSYFVDNQLQIKLRDFNQIGKILVKVQELEMTFNNDIVYSLSDEHREKIIQQHQAIMFNKMLTQANIYLGNNQNGYTLGNLVSFNPNLNSPQPVIPQPAMINNISEIRMEKSVSAIDVNKIIQAPSEYEVTLSMSGVFEVIKKRYQP